jgi:hypothetical protein
MAILVLKDIKSFFLVLPKFIKYIVHQTHPSSRLKKPCIYVHQFSILH